jgi:hypothetical protein
MFATLAGGARGAAMIVFLALAGTLIPLKLGALFLDPVILLAYTWVAILLASNFTVRGVVGSTEFRVVRRVALLGSLFGWLSWAVVLGVSLAALSSWRARVSLPPLTMLAALVLLAWATAWLASCLAAVAALNVQTVKAARDMMRLGFFLLLLLAVMGPRFLPLEWQQSLSRFVTGARLVPALFAAAICFVPAGLALLGHARRLIQDRGLRLGINEG